MPAALDAWIAAGVRRGLPPVELVAACARVLARPLDLPMEGGPRLLLRGDAVDPPPDAGLSPWLLGRVYEQALDAGQRHSQGIHYTPPSVARGLARIALAGAGDTAEVCDPAVGGGVFLLAAAEVLAGRGLDRHTIVSERLWGIDLDPLAVEVSEAALALWGSVEGTGWATNAGHLVCADTLVEGAGAFDGRATGFAVVLGNPPFQNQLGSGTARSAEEGRALRRRWSTDAGTYTDTAAYFLVAGLELASPQGTVVLVQPQSVLVAGDAQAIRRRVTAEAALTGLWLGDLGVFEAQVRVCAPVLDKGAAPAPVRRWTGESVVATRSAPGVVSSTSWSSLVSDLLGVPRIEPATGGILRDICTATAGFRDQFYGLAAHTMEGSSSGGDLVPLITVGMIDPLRNRRGTGEFRFHGRRWLEPFVNRETLRSADPTLAAWVEDRMVPKVLVATQTKVIEVVVDQVGNLVPSTPVIAVVSEADRLWHVAAMLSAPAISAIAFSRTAGAALSADTLKLSAKQVLALPMPADSGAWDEGARLAEVASLAQGADQWNAALDGLGEAMGRAYGLGDAAETAQQWWRNRRPSWR